MDKDKLWNIKSSWILPSGEIMIVPCEMHDDYIPDFCKDRKCAEQACVKISCGWGYDSPISEIYLPRILTNYQAIVLRDIQEGLEIENKSIKNKINKWHNPMSWNEIIERI